MKVDIDDSIYVTGVELAAQLYSLTPSHTGRLPC